MQITNWNDIIYRQVESDTLDYKYPLNWVKMPRHAKAKFVRHCLALANTRGGFIVVGVGEDASGHPSVYTGLTPEEAKSFDPSLVGAFINRHVDPPIDFTVERPIVDGKRYAVFVVNPFSGVPHVCNSTINDELQQGVFYIRTSDASSRPAFRASELHALIQRALRNQRALLGRMLRGLLYENNFITDESASRSHFEEERRHARDFFLARNRTDAAMPSCRLELTMAPNIYTAEKFSIRELKDATLNSIDRVAEMRYVIPAEVRKGYNASTSLRVFPPTHDKLWQLNMSGLCFYTRTIEMPDNKLDFVEITRILRAATNLTANLYTELGYTDELIRLGLRLRSCENAELVNSKGEPFPPGCRCVPRGITLNLERSAADWLSGKDVHYEHLIHSFAESFNVPDSRLAMLRK